MKSTIFALASGLFILVGAASCRQESPDSGLDSDPPAAGAVREATPADTADNPATDPTTPAPAPGTTTAPAPGTTTAPGPGTSTAPSPGTTPAPAPGTSTAPSPGTTPAPAPGTSTAPGASPPMRSGTAPPATGAAMNDGGP